MFGVCPAGEARNTHLCHLCYPFGRIVQEVYWLSVVSAVLPLTYLHVAADFSGKLSGKTACPLPQTFVLHGSDQVWGKGPWEAGHGFCFWDQMLPVGELASWTTGRS